MATHRSSKPAALVATLGAILTLGATPVVADPPAWAGHGNPHESRGYDKDSGPHGSDRREHRREQRHFHISTREQQYIQNWYHRHLPPGLAKQGKIPPGHARKLRRGAPWPPPYDYEPLPPHVVANLQPLPPGYRYYRVGADVVIANLAGNVVADVVYDLLNR